MNTALIMLGSNVDAEQNIETAKEKIAEYYEIAAEGTRIATKAQGKQYKADFINEAIRILSDDTAEATRSTFKQIEMEMGRTAQSKSTGIIPIDIDLILWNENIVHQDYERFDFVRKCIDEIRH